MQVASKDKAITWKNKSFTSINLFLLYLVMDMILKIKIISLFDAVYLIRIYSDQ